MPPPAGDNHGRVVFAVRTGFALGHRASTFRACAHLMKTAARYQLRAPRSIFVPGTQHVWWGRGDKSRRASTRCDCRGKSRLAGLTRLNGGGGGQREGQQWLIRCPLCYFYQLPTQRRLPLGQAINTPRVIPFQTPSVKDIV